MNKQCYTINNNVRFRRWSRANYAIFSSLSRCVTIGTVCTSICEMSCKKSTTLSTQQYNQIFSANNQEDEENNEPELQFILQNYLEQIINSKLTSITAVAAIITSNYYNITLRLE